MTNGANGSQGAGMGGMAMAGGAAGAVILAVAGYFLYQVMQADEGVDPPVAAMPAAPVSAPDAPPSVSAAGTPETALAPAPADTAPIVPSFDIARVDADGNALVAGRADPMAEVSVMVDGVEVATAVADNAGEFVAMFSMQGNGAPQVMSLNVGGEEVVASTESVIVTAPVAPVPETPAEIAPVEVVEAPPEPAADPTTDDATTDETTLAEATPDPDPAAPQILLADEDGITVLQDAGSVAPEALEAISIDTIAYDEEGAVELTGRGREDRQVLVYLNNALIRTVRVAEDGQWRAPLPDVVIGVHTLRVDEVAEDGAVTSRSETPFKREEPEALVAAAVSAGSEAAGRPPVQRITVQPGATLWAIARQKYGDGVRYVQVFDANRDRIRDPDLIYPGQVFELPEQ